MKKKIVCIFETDHGFLAAAENYDHAISWLIDNDWLNEVSDYLDDEACEERTLEDGFGDNWIFVLSNLNIEKFNEMFPNGIRLEESEVV